MINLQRRNRLVDCGPSASECSPILAGSEAIPASPWRHLLRIRLDHQPPLLLAVNPSGLVILPRSQPTMVGHSFNKIAMAIWTLRASGTRSEEHTSELQSPCNLV